MKPQTALLASLFLVVAFVITGILIRPTCACGNDLEPVQQGPSRGSISAPRDPEAEKSSYKSLDAAKFYFYKRKPDKGDKDGMARLNKAVLDRLQEIIDLNPQFGRIEEVYFLMGEVHQRGGDTEQAVEYWTKAVKEGSDEKVKAEAQKRLDEAKNQKKKG
ncbi:MAG: tetratricopeptide repeat protein [Blastocatellia bacterium]